MWELDYKESGALKNWCFWTVELEKTLESPLDCKEIQPVHPKGNQSWIFTGRTGAEAETLILGPPDAKNWLIWKYPDAGEGDNRGWDGWMASLAQWTRVWVNSRSWWWTGRPGVLQSMGLQSWTRLTVLNWLIWLKNPKNHAHENYMKSKFHGAQIKVLLAHSPLCHSFCIVYGCPLDYNSRGKSGNRDHSALCRKHWLNPGLDLNDDRKTDVWRSRGHSFLSRQRPRDNDKHDTYDRSQGQCGYGAEGKRWEEVVLEKQTRPEATQVCRRGEGTWIHSRVGGGKMGERHPQV